MGPWEAGQIRGTRRGAPVQVGSGCGCWKTPHKSEVGFGDRYLQSPGEDRVGSGGAVLQQLCAAVPMLVQQL